MRRCLFVFLIFCGGCDTLFPEFAGSAPSADLAGTDAGSDSPEIAGALLVLEDLREFRTCSSGVPSGLNFSVEETRDSAPVDATGAFTLPLSVGVEPRHLRRCRSQRHLRPHRHHHRAHQADAP